MGRTRCWTVRVSSTEALLAEHAANILIQMACNSLVIRHRHCLRDPSEATESETRGLGANGSAIANRSKVVNIVPPDRYTREPCIDGARSSGYKLWKGVLM